MPDRGDGVLWRVRETAIRHGAEVDVVEVLADIAGNAEGLTIDAARGRALVLFDGKDADGDWSPERPHLCVEHARQDVIVLPAAPLRTSARRDD